ncbi:MAG: hypothetical protein AAGG02_09670 [Cyanobacteria bacterium P01_H01_bin.15]
MAKRNTFEKQLQELAQLIKNPSATDYEFTLRRGLMSKHGVVVSRAAKATALLQWQEGVPEMRKAFERLTHNGADVDPGCFGKTEIIEALRSLKAYECSLYVKGIQYHQFEKVYGGSEDTAGPLRGACAIALAANACVEALLQIGELLADPRAEARVGAAKALVHLAGDAPLALLRLRALSGETHTAVLEEIFASMFALSPANPDPDASDETVRLIAKFLQSKDYDIVSLAAIALGSSRRIQAFAALRDFAENSFDSASKQIAFQAIALVLLPEAIDYAIDIIERGDEMEAKWAEEGLAIYRENETIWNRVEAARDKRYGMDDFYANLFKD